MSDMYSFGVILLELFKPLGTKTDQVQVLTGLRTGQILESLSKTKVKCIQHLTRKNATQTALFS